MRRDAWGDGAGAWVLGGVEAGKALPAIRVLMQWNGNRWASTSRRSRSRMRT